MEQGTRKLVPQHSVGECEEEEGDSTMARKAKLGSGKRFRALKGKLARRGARNPGALAAYIGRKKYGKKKMAKMSAAGRRRKSRSRGRRRK